MKARLSFISLCLFSVAACAEEAGSTSTEKQEASAITTQKEESSSLTTQKQKLSYFIGFQVGQSFKQQGLDVDVDVVSAAIKDVMADAKPKLTMEEMKATVEILQAESAKKAAAAAEVNKAAGEVNKKAGADFLDANKKKEGVITLPSGVQYKIVTQGQGKKPKATDTVVVNYRGTLIDGKEFDSSYKRGEPATFPVNGVIKGWQEVLPLMQEGSKWQIVIPSELAYGAAGTGGDIGPNATLLFDVELMSVK
ncbi:MAG: FKBP-type peptidyl-prolyl cis-trans isomerase [Gammaproteobacteria bacterium]